MDLDAYRHLRAEARRHARRAQDADDLVQDALLIALTGVVLLVCLALAWLVARHFGLSAEVALLIGLGTAICGASASYSGLLTIGSTAVCIRRISARKWMKSLSSK